MGDEQSGVDAGLEALEGMSFAPTVASGPSDGDEKQSTKLDKRPVWVREAEGRRGEPSADVHFLRERGYPSSEATAARRTTKSRIAALKKLYNATGAGEQLESNAGETDVPEEVVQARTEEKEVLLAMFGFADEDDEAAATFRDAEDENALDAVLPVAGYEPPERYGASSCPPLMMEVYVDNGIAPLYPNEPPVIAVAGGGLPESRLWELTDRIRAEARERVTEEPGEPQIFNLITFAGEAAESIVEEEALELEAERKKILEAKRVAAAAARRDAQKGSLEQDESAGVGFASEADRRAYAREVAARAADPFSKGLDEGVKKKASAAAPKFNAKTGVSDRNLIKDLFS
mmetsp:Transcript_52673/g.111892  ORF Transcript_52673/g.111892 Transcript_52673/m.111892 type:complete len:347 (-) Transcript_52673:74-1114(-)